MIWFTLQEIIFGLRIYREVDPREERVPDKGRDKTAKETLKET